MTGTTHITIHTNSCPGGEGGGGNVAGLIVGPSPPSVPLPPPNDGVSNLWWDTNNGQLYIWTGNEWVAASCCEGGGAGSLVTIGQQPPPIPTAGQLWWNTNDGQLYVFTGNQWVAASCCEGSTGGGGGEVASVFGRTGIVIAQTGDYSFAQISGVAAPAQLPLFSSVTNGVVPAPGAATPATYVLQANGTWAAQATSGGTVTSVAMTVPSGLSVAGSPITGAGTLAVSWSGTIPNAQVPAPTASALGGVQSATALANQFATGINTSGQLTFAQPAFSNLSGNITLTQLPAIANNTVLGNVSGVAATPTALMPAQLTALVNPFTSTLNGAVPAPGASTPATYVLQANGTWAAVATGGSGTVTSVAMTVPSGLSVAGSPITTNGTFGLTWSGTIPNAQIPTPTATALGGVISSSAPANQFATGITTAGAVTYAQPSFANISGTLATGQLPAGTGTVTSVGMTVPSGLAVSGSPVTTSGTLGVTWSGTIPNAQVPAPTTSALGGVQSASAPAGQFMTGISTAGVPQFASPVSNMPTIRQFTSGTGTYTPAAGVSWIRVRMVGGGGGGSGTTAGGSNGGTTSFGGWTAIGGSGAPAGGAGGAGGSGGAAGTGTLVVRMNGGPGGWGSGWGPGSSGASAALQGASGGTSYFGGTGTGVAGPSANSGSGGAGSQINNGNAFGGGGAGQYVEFLMSTPGSLSYAVGAGGGGGASGGFTGAVGIILVEENY